MSEPIPQLGEVDTWIFDLDNTLYPAGTSVSAQVSCRMNDYIARALELDEDSALKLRRELFLAYGTTLRGLMTRHAIDPHHFLAYAHDLDLSELAPSPALAAALAVLPGRKIIHTNADAAHAERITRRLGIAEHFHGVIDIAAADWQPKPDLGGYRTLIERFSVDPSRAIMIEDMARNLKPAAALGMHTLWVRNANDWGGEGSNEPWVHHRTDDLALWLTQAVRPPACG
jgi:putative hydrolase of the HAD superfamily